MSERIVALDRNGTLRLIAVNGDGPREVGHLEVGHLPDYDAAMIAAAFADLRALAIRPISAPAPAPRVADVAQVTHAAPELGKARKPTKRTGKRAPAERGAHKALIVAYLSEHGSARCAPMARALGITVKQASNALGSMGHSKPPSARNVDGVWSLTGEAPPPRLGTTPVARPGSPAPTARTEDAAARLLEVLARSPEGVGGLALFTMAKVDRGERRALDLLVKRGRVRREGNTRGAVWHYVAPEGVLEPELALEPDAEPEGQGEPERVHALERYL